MFFRIEERTAWFDVGGNDPTVGKADDVDRAVESLELVFLRRSEGTDSVHTRRRSP